MVETFKECAIQAGTEGSELSISIPGYVAVRYAVRNGECGSRSADPSRCVVEAVVVGFGEGVEMLHATSREAHRRSLPPAPQKSSFVLAPEFTYQTNKNNILRVTDFQFIMEFD